jgi:hypothetical protein
VERVYRSTFLVPLETPMNDPLDTFLRLILPWETADQQLYKSVTWKFPKIQDPNDKRPPMANYATQDYNSLVQLIRSRAAKPQHDIWICLGTQRLADQTKITKDGYPKAIRQYQNIVSLKSIWLDVDVGKQDAYATQAEAIGAVAAFNAAIGMPAPTMIVFSGSGGMHVYWCTNISMTLEQWRPLSVGLQQAAVQFGLKFDPQVTVNGAGILRVPGTFNWKDPNVAKPVTLAPTAHQVYSYQQLHQVLGQYAGNVTPIKQGGQMSNWSANFAAGVQAAAPSPALIDIAANCPTVDDVLTRGGNGDSEGLWNLMMLLASFTDDPVASAHALSDKDPRYTQAETDRKLTEKINARATNANIGWPKCASIQPFSPKCMACPLLAQGKSPLAFANKPANAPPGATPQTGDPILPPEYWRDTNGHVFTLVTVPDKEAEGGGTKTIVMDVLEHPVVDAGVDPTTGRLIFKTNISGVERWIDVNVSGSMQPTAMATALSANNGVFIPAHKHKIARDFMVAWVAHLQRTKREMKAATYGWTDDQTGFTFDKTTYYDTGPVVAFRGASFDPKYSKKGDLQPWKDTLPLVYGNLPLEVVVASSFGAPLTALLGTTSCILSIHSALSGVGKSTAMKIAQAVWGDPITGM